MKGGNIRGLIDESIPYKEHITENHAFTHMQYFKSSQLRVALETTSYEILIIGDVEKHKKVISKHKENHLLSVILINETATKTEHADFVVQTIESCHESLKHIIYCIKEMYSNKLFEILAQLIKVRTIDAFNQIDHVKQITEIILSHLVRIKTSICSIINIV